MWWKRLRTYELIVHKDEETVQMIATLKLESFDYESKLMLTINVNTPPWLG